MRLMSFVSVWCALNASSAVAQPLFTDAFPIEEFAERRGRVEELVGDGVAILQGAAEYPAYVRFRQNNQFFYLCGVEVPRAILLIDGRTGSSTLYLPPRDERRERSEGPILGPGEEAARLAGIDKVLPRSEFARALIQIGQEGRTLYMPFRPEALAASVTSLLLDHEAASANDPWDGRPSREAVFIQRVRELIPQTPIQNLDPMLDEMRLIKSPREIALIREATRIDGLAMMEVMRSAEPGMFEYELEAVGGYVFRKHNAEVTYFGLVATGNNAYYPHYHALQSQLKDGDLVLYDHAPDYKYYTSDVTRMFPANGRFSADQRELYTAYLRLYQALMASIRPYVTPKEIIQDAVKQMDEILASYRFTSPKHAEAAARFVDRFRNSDRLGHWVGMEAHDVTAPFDVLKPGMVFTIEPALVIPEERVYVRIEDIILITEHGCENLSAFVPVEVEDIEKLMREQEVSSLEG